MVLCLLIGQGKVQTCLLIISFVDCYLISDHQVLIGCSPNANGISSLGIISFCSQFGSTTDHSQLLLVSHWSVAPASGSWLAFIEMAERNRLFCFKVTRLCPWSSCLCMITIPLFSSNLHVRVSPLTQQRDRAASFCVVIGSARGHQLLYFH